MPGVELEALKLSDAEQAALDAILDAELVRKNSIYTLCGPC